MIEGNRGTGKSHILRYAEYLCDKTFNKKKILGVYITFTESLKIETFKSQYGDYDPFMQWVSMKTLSAIFEKIQKLGLVKEPGILKKITSKFVKNNTDPERLFLEFNHMINIMEMTPGGQEKNVFEINLKVLDSLPSIGGKKENAKEILHNLEHIPIIKSSIQTLAESLAITRVVLFFDEAAHTLVPDQQGKFFTFFKGLKDSKIAVKAAVYPLITNYGPSIRLFTRCKNY